MLRAIALIAALAGCNVHRTFECGLDSDCSTSGVCESTRYCSFADSACPSGRRYDEYAGGGLAGDCVGAMAVDAAIPDTPVVVPGCPGYQKVGTLPGGYRKSTANAGWLMGETDCEDDVAGMTHLAVVSDANENAMLRPFLGADRVWIGINDRVTEGTYRAVNNPANTSQTYLPWEASEPDDLLTDDCVALRDEEFFNEDCTDSRPYICECDGLPAIAGSY